MANQPPNRNDDRGKEEYRDGFQVAEPPLGYEEAAVPPPRPFSYFYHTDPTNPNRAAPVFQSIEEDGPNSNQAWQRHRERYSQVIQNSRSIGRLEWQFGGGYSSDVMARKILNRNMYDWVPYFLGYGQFPPYLQAFYAQSQSQSQSQAASSSSSSRAAGGRGRGRGR